MIDLFTKCDPQVVHTFYVWFRFVVCVCVRARCVTKLVLVGNYVCIYKSIQLLV